MNILSLFDGISCARVAIGNRVNTYYASEIDPYAIKIAKKNFPDTIQLGDVTKIKAEHVKHPIDLLIGGSPCQDLSIGNTTRKGLKGGRSKLFWEYARILKEIKPKYFVFENVASMSKEDCETISTELGVKPIMINASLVSAQNRKRLFWTNIKNVIQPKDRGIMLKDILESGIEGNPPPSKFTEIKSTKTTQIGYYGSKNLGHGGQCSRVYSIDGKAPTGGGCYFKIGTDNPIIRKLTPIECERLQSLPDNYTNHVSNTQRFKSLRNGFNVEVVKHIISFI
jgi:DNA (cytosine-5)-methyltransferase 3A